MHFEWYPVVTTGGQLLLSCKVKLLFDQRQKVGDVGCQVLLNGLKVQMTFQDDAEPCVGPVGLVEECLRRAELLLR